MKKRVLFITNIYPSNSEPTSGIFVHEQARALAMEKEWCIDVIYLRQRVFGKRQKGEKKECDYTFDGVHVHCINYFFIPKKLFYGISVFLCRLFTKRCIINYLKHKKIDLIHAHWITPAGYVASTISKKKKIPLVCTVRGSDVNSYPYYGNLSRRFTMETIKRCNAVFGVSSSICKETLKFGAEQNKTFVVYNGYDDTSFYKMISRPVINVVNEFKRQQKSIVLFVGHLKKEKGVFELVYASKLLKEEGEKFATILIGSGPEKENLLNFIQDNNLNDVIYLFGEEKHEKMNGWYNSCDVFVLPSHKEGLPNVVLEAAVAGCTIVATSLPGICEIVGDNAYYANVGDVFDLKEKISLAIKMPISVDQAFIKNKFSRSLNINRLISYYNLVCGKGIKK